jgi:hypothetical protein
MSRLLQPANEHFEFPQSIRTAAIFASVTLEETPAALTLFSPTSEIVLSNLLIGASRFPR